MLTILDQGQFNSGPVSVRTGDTLKIGVGNDDALFYVPVNGESKVLSHFAKVRIGEWIGCIAGDNKLLDALSILKRAEASVMCVQQTVAYPREEELFDSDDAPWAERPSTEDF